jgi:hypothetical protein
MEEVIVDSVSGHLLRPLDTAGIAARALELLADPERRRARRRGRRRYQLVPPP